MNAFSKRWKRTKRPLRFAIALAAALCIGCDIAEPAFKKSAPSSASTQAVQLVRRTWNFKSSQKRADVGWPANVSSEMWFITDPFTLEISIDGRESIQYEVATALVTRRSDDLFVIDIEFASESLGAAVVRSKTLMRTWNIDDRKGAFETWYRKRLGDPDDRAGPRTLIINGPRIDDKPPAPSLVIRPAFKFGKPWFVSLRLSFAPSWAIPPATSSTK